MVPIAAALAIASVAGVLAWLLRRRPAPPQLSSRVGPLPAGVKHLAATLSDLSDLEFHLPVARRALSRRPRPGFLLGQR